MQNEPKSQTSRIVYGALAAVWLLLAAWLAVERGQVAGLARQGVLNRARDISGTIALVSRSGPPGAIPESRLERLLNELVETTELTAVALLNAAGETVATAGEPLHLDINALPAQGARWNPDSVTVVNLVDFGQTTRDDGTPNPPTVVLSRSEEEAGRRRFMRRRDDRQTTGTINRPDGEVPLMPPPMPPFALDEDGPSDPAGAGELAGDETPRSSRRRDERRAREPEVGPPRFVFHRPFWIDPERYEELLAKRGLHGFVFVMSTEKMRADLARDLWLRLGVAGAALAAVVGLGFGWRGLARSTDLRIRLVRAQEMNEHLREMNLAAAGLAHEARNPLNIVRGIAQMIDKDERLPEEARAQADRITEEVDRVTQRLNEFIKYSRPMQPRPAAARLATIVADVLAALQSDMEDKQVKSEIRVAGQSIVADESMLRQVVFNLVLNAIQAVKQGGRVAVEFSAPPHSEGVLSVEDDGPGVPLEQRDQIFRPYFTTQAQGSGLGLAVVKQIVLAHHWEIECGSSAMGGAAFRIHGVEVVEAEGEAKT